MNVCSLSLSLSLSLGPATQRMRRGPVEHPISMQLRPQGHCAPATNLHAATMIRKHLGSLVIS